MCVLTLVFYVLVYYSSDCIKGRYMDVVEWSRELDVEMKKEWDNHEATCDYHSKSMEG
jgi:hypothetical protein